MKNYLISPERYIEVKNLIQVKNGKTKTRKLVTYQKNIDGDSLRYNHEILLRKLDKKFKSSKCSFAYKKGFSCKDALKAHMESKKFIKIDIKNFFEGISYKNFINICSNYYKIDKFINELKICFYEDSLGLGLVTSPKLSDMYLYGFDTTVMKYIKKNKELKYSRYSDDILISTTSDDSASLEDLYGFIRNTLATFYLEINDLKVLRCDLEKKDSAISYLGLTISRHDGKNRITVGKSYIMRILKLLEKNKLSRQDYETCRLDIKSRKQCIVEYHKEANDPYVIETKELIKSNSRLWRLIVKRKQTIMSLVGYLKYNSKESYNRFLKKYKNFYHTEWKGI